MKQPMVVYLCWHPDSHSAPLAEECYKQLCRNPDRPFSRGMQIPVFFRSITPLGEEKPLPIKLGDQERTAIFVFADDKLVASDPWNSYINGMFTRTTLSPENHRMFVVALTQNAFNLSGRISQTNFIRLYEVSPEIRDKLLLVHMAHELCRLLESSPRFSLREKHQLGRPVKLFLSHAKKDEKALKLAIALKVLIDNSTLTRFFDKVNIAPGDDFAIEIEASIEDSAVVCIRSDSYSSRPWCQREVLYAKKQKCPILIVDILENFDDRTFPYLGNVPSIRLSEQDQDNTATLYSIIESALLETLRSYYAYEYLEFLRLQSLIPKDAIILTRPPESIDIGVLSKSPPQIIKVIYPDPPLVPDELDLLQNDNLTFSTPLTSELVTLQGLKVGLSISEPEKFELAAIGMNDNHIKSFLNELTRYLLLYGAQLLYGGDLRKDGYTEFLFETARYLKIRYKSDLQRVRNYLAWPYSLNLDEAWIAANRSVAEFVQIKPPDDIRQQIPDIRQELPSDTIKNRVILARCLEEMRYKLIRDSHARISVGGRCFGYKGKYPGIVEESLIAVETQTPLYVLGGFGGASKQVALALQGKEAPSLIMECQTSHCLNSIYADMVSEFNHRIGELKSERIDYEVVTQKLAGYGMDSLSRLNGLTKDENQLLFEITCLEEAVSLILKGLKTIPRPNAKSNSSDNRINTAENRNK